MFNSDLTKHLAELSKLEFTDEELEQMTADMTNIIAIMDKVCEFDTSKPAYALISLLSSISLSFFKATLIKSFLLTVKLL